jgi:hypothetical protein
MRIDALTMIDWQGEKQKCHIHVGGSSLRGDAAGILRNSDKGEI